MIAATESILKEVATTTLAAAITAQILQEALTIQRTLHLDQDLIILLLLEAVHQEVAEEQILVEDDKKIILIT